MLTILALILSPATPAAQAAKWATVQCLLDSGAGKAVASPNSVEKFVSECGDKFFAGDVCFTGDRGTAIQVIESLQEADLYGGEYSIENVHFKGRNEISYTIWDGPNDTEASKNYIGRCD